MKSITDAKLFDSFLFNDRLPPYIARNSTSAVNWPLTQDWCKRNNTPDVTSTNKSKLDAFKLKSLNHILPCGDILRKHYPLLYEHLQGDIPCPICSSNADTNAHISFCPTLWPTLDTLLEELRIVLRVKIIAATPDNITT